MADLSRRNFLTATVAAAAGGTALVLAAPTDTLQLFQPTMAEVLAVTRVPQHLDPGPRVWWPVSPGEVLFNSRGAAVCIVDEVIMHRDMYNDTRFGNSFQHSVPSPRMDIDIRAKGIFDPTYHNGVQGA